MGDSSLLMIEYSAESVINILAEIYRDNMKLDFFWTGEYVKESFTSIT